MTYRIGPWVARVARLFYYFLKFFKKSEAWVGEPGISLATLATLVTCPYK